jgi:hypothetical protein
MMAGKTNAINITSTSADTGKGNAPLTSSTSRTGSRNVRSRHRRGTKATDGGPTNNNSTFITTSATAIRDPVSLTEPGTRAGTSTGSDIVSVGGSVESGGVVDYFVLEGSELSIIAETEPWDESSSREQ